MKLQSRPLTPEADQTDKTAAIARVACHVCFCAILLLPACRPAPDLPPPPPAQPVPKAASASVVPIPEDFLSPPPTPVPKPTVLPRVVFATSDFQVTTRHGIQGIRAGEALNFIREEAGDYVVQYGALEFRKNRSYFAATYVEPSQPEPTPVAGENPPVAAGPSAEPALPDEPPLSGPIPSDDQSLLAEQKKVGVLTDSIRELNDQIRSAQNELEKKSSQDPRKTYRSLQKLKAQRDVLSSQLTEMGKP